MALSSPWSNENPIEQRVIIEFATKKISAVIQLSHPFGIPGAYIFAIQSLQVLPNKRPIIAGQLIQLSNPQIPYCFHVLNTHIHI